MFKKSVKAVKDFFAQKQFYGLLKDIVGFWGSRSGTRANYTYTNYRYLCDATYNYNPDFHEIVNLVARECAELPLCFKDDDGKKVETPNLSPEYLRFIRAPLVSGGSFKELVRLLFVTWDICGERWVIKKQNMSFQEFNDKAPIDSVAVVKPNFITQIYYSDGTPSRIELENSFFHELNGYRPDLTKNKPTGYHEKRDYEVKYRNGDLISQIGWQIKESPTISGRGIGIAVPLLNDIEILNNGKIFNRSSLENGGSLSGYLYYPPKTRGAQKAGSARIGGQESASSIEEDMKNKIAGPRNAKKFMFLKGGLQFKESQQTMRDLDFLSGLSYSRLSIANAKYVPPEVVGSQEASTFSNRREAREYFISNTCVSTMEEFLDFFNYHLLRPHFKEFKNMRLSVDKSVLDETVNKRTKLWESLEKTNTLTLNEKREMIGVDKSNEENADRILIPQGLGLIEEVGMPDDTENTFEDPLTEENNKE